MIKRLPLKKVRIFDLVNGKFSKGDVETKKPSFLITPYGEKVSRVDIVGTVTEKFVSEDENYGVITLDDGTEAIRVKGFENKVKFLKQIEVGDIVRVIGRVRFFNDEIYVSLEVLIKIDDPNFELLRKVELLKKIKQRKSVIEKVRELATRSFENALEEVKKFGFDEESLRFALSFSAIKENYKEKILKLFEELDEGDGVDVSKIFEILDLPENIIEKTIDELLDEGLIFEPLPGKFKIIKA